MRWSMNRQKSKELASMPSCPTPTEITVHRYQTIRKRAYRKVSPRGKRERPPWVVPETVTLTKTVKHRDEHGRLLSVEIRAALGAAMKPPGTVHVERLNGALRDRLGALTRKTHAFAKRDATLAAQVAS